MQHTEENGLINDENEAPLTKTKTKGRPKKVSVDSPQTQKDDAESDELPPIQPKVTKPRSDTQLAAFSTAQEKVKANRAKKLEDKKIEASKLLLEKYGEPSAKKIQMSDPVPDAKQVDDDTPNTDYNQNCEIVYVKREKKPKPAPKKKKIIIYHDNSSSEEEEEEEETQEIHIKKSPRFKTQQNKKSLIKVGVSPSIAPDKRNSEMNQSRNFFCD